MNRFPKAEKILLGIGVFLFLISTFLFVFETDRLGQMLGLTSGSSREVVAKVETMHDMARRKTMDSPEFQPVTEKQTIFSQDTIMTGSGSGLVLSFTSGDVIELGPDTLVQIETKNPTADSDNLEFTIDVQKGQVVGKSIGQKIQVKQNGKVAPLAPITEKSIAAYLVYPKQKPKEVVCHFGTKQLIAPDQTPTLQPKIFVEVTCDGDTNNIDVTVKNKKGETVQVLTVDIGPDHQGKLEFLVATADTYRIEMKQETPESVSVLVPTTYEALSWASPGLRCDYGVAWKPLPKIGKKIILTDDTGLILKEESNLSVDHFSLLNNILHPPKKLYLQLALGTGFTLRTAELPVASWRSCPVLKFPGDGAKKVFSSRIPILFTWSSLGHDDHYLFEVSTDPTFKAILYTAKTNQNLGRFGPKKKGVFYWRVQELKTHAFSDVYAFTIR